MSHEPQAPKGIAWLIIYRQPGKRAIVVRVEDDRHGLTAYEAWRTSSVPVSFSASQVVQLDPYPSVNTKRRSHVRKVKSIRNGSGPQSHRSGLRNVRETPSGTVARR